MGQQRLLSSCREALSESTGAGRQVGPAGRAAHSLLSLRAWVVLEPLSYSAYLYHEQVRVRTLRRSPVSLTCSICFRLT